MTERASPTTVPGNRWDLVVDRVAAARQRGLGPIAIVITYYRQPRQLGFMFEALLAAGLDGQTEIVVVDDGSDEPPPAPPLGLTVQVLRQRDLGFRAAAARNLGVRSTTADHLVFLDADTIPAPGGLAALAAWPAVLPDALVVGARQHVDLSGMDDPDRHRWLHSGTGKGPRPFEQPDWLAAGYRASGNLLNADDRSYRYVISGVMACHRRLFTDIGGFDASIRAYAGEDWDFAFRAFNNGAVLVHEPRAVTWHDGAAWGERSGDWRSRNAETLRLAERIPVSGSRTPGVVHRWADLLVQLVLGPDYDVDVAVATVLSVLAGVQDVQVYLDEDQDPVVAAFFRHDGRVRFGAVPPDVAQRSRSVVTIGRPLRWTGGALARIVAAVRPGGVGLVRVYDGDDVVVTVEATRAIGRARRNGADDPSALIADLFGTHDLGLADAGAVLLPHDIDLPAVIDIISHGQR